MAEDERIEGLEPEEPTGPAAEPSETPAAGDGAGPSRPGLRRKIWIAVGVVLGVLLLLIAFDVVTASPKTCTTCHEMRARHDSWAKSSHVEVSCVKCHQPPTAWYQLPQRLAGRVALLSRDVAAHAAGGYDDPVDSRVAGTEPIKDEICLQCHDVNRKATSGFRILIDHPEHAKRNGSCVSCHVRTAHPVATRGKAITFMSQCFTCHGTEAYPEASAECGVCHPKDYKLLPESHAVEPWKKDHGKTALKDPKQCEMCHTDAFCTGCHGVKMPHPQGWERGENGHAAAATANRAVCGKCHGSRPDSCTMCHHQGYDPAQGTWLKQHFLVVRDKGAAHCLDCHSPVFCVKCHVSRAPAEARPAEQSATP